MSHIHRALSALPALAILLSVAIAGSTFLPASPSGSAAELTRKVYLPAVINANASVQSIFGIEVTGMEAAANVSRVAATGQSLNAGFVRRNQINWATVEATRGTYNFASTDADLLRAAQVGGRPIVIVQGTPVWARTSVFPSVNGPFPVLFLADYANFWKAVVARYSKPPYNVKYWEVYNEPDNTLGDASIANVVANWGDNPAGFAKVLKTAYPAIKSVDPTATVIMGSLAHDYFKDTIDQSIIKMEPGIFRRDFLDLVLAAGGGPYFDALGFHYYPDFDARWLAKKPTLAPNVVVAKAESLRDILRKYSLTKPIYNTEIGAASNTICDASSTAEVQARTLVKLFTRSAAANLQSVVWYRLSDDANVIPDDCFGFHGLIGSDGATKIAFTAFSVTSQVLGTATFVRPLTSADTGRTNVEGYLFRNSLGKDLRLLWTTDDSSATVNIPGAVTLTSMKKDGIPQLIPGATVTFTGDPVFVTTN